MTRVGFIYLMLSFLLFGAVSCKTKNGAAENITREETDLEITENGKPVIVFSTESHDFGDILSGEKVSFTFSYHNEGDANLIIESASASCGCTVPKWSKEPLPPGEKGTIEVVFDGSGRSGMQMKNVTIRSNAEPSLKVLQITANVIESE
ncbi:MAG: DUF1573 domain-containing protein [Bacteroidales bacterium]|nr:MAG: DUF1573 domain-containing protein [Bacteroidales bacterium]